jgi:hypothetical protein
VPHDAFSFPRRLRAFTALLLGACSEDHGTLKEAADADPDHATVGANGGTSPTSGGTPGNGGAAAAGGKSGSGGSGGAGGAGAGTAPDAGVGSVDSGSPDASKPVTSGCRAFDMPSVATLRQSKHKVFAHYFAPYPLSIDNAAPDKDYYARGYLAPDGEAGKWAFCGGLLRDRPLVMTPSTDANWADENYDTEVRRAIDMGIDGFTFDILGTTGTNWDRLGLLLKAAERVDPTFRVALMPDMYSTFTGDAAAATTQFVDSIASTVAAHPKSVYALDDGRIVVAPYGVEKRDAAWWLATLEALTDRGVPNAFVPLFSNVPWLKAATDMKPTVPLYGVASWGVRTPSGVPGIEGAAASAHALDLIWMAPVAPQDMRPKSLVYREARNSLAFRQEWDAAITGGADWVQLITWNDYSEHSEVSPSERGRYAFADLSAYYAVWFKTGRAPPIVRDRLLYFHRAQATTAKPDLGKQTGGVFALADATPASDEIEVVAMLKAPGTLRVRIGDQTRTMDAPAGLSSLRAPLGEGTPEFDLVRNGSPVLSVTSDWPITSSITYQDLYYRGGGSPRCGP